MGRDVGIYPKIKKLPQVILRQFLKCSGSNVANPELFVGDWEKLPSMNNQVLRILN